MSKGQVHIIGLSGIIGAGKSQALRRLEESEYLKNHVEQLWAEQRPQDAVPLVLFMQEPVNIWIEQNWLSTFYSDPAAHALAFQFLVFTTHVAEVNKHIAMRSNPDQDLVLVVERTMYDQRLFWETQEAHEMHDTAYARLWVEWHRFIPKPKLVFFFQTSTLDLTMERVKARARPEEKEIPREYQAKLLENHHRWFQEPIARPPPPKVNKKKGEPGYGEDVGLEVPCKHVISDVPYHTCEEELEKLAKMMAGEIGKVVFPSGSARREYNSGE